MKEWQKIERVTPTMLSMWRTTWPGATDTGALTKWMPSIDLDILREDAAIGCEEMIRERFEERGWFLVPIGKAPKRLIPFRLAGPPFEKMTVNFIGEPAQKIELLGSGQQAMLDGVHVETRQRYRWHGGQPWEIDRDDLPDISADEAYRLMEDVADLLTREFGYVRKSPTRSVATGRAVAGAPVTGEARWAELIGEVLAGNAFHDPLTALAAMAIRAGMDKGAAMHLLGGLMENSAAPHDARWDARYRDLPRAIDTAVAKFTKR